ncbi:MAG: ATPase, AAA family [uncultured Sulfurovum sp.]|uniref:ATPase, AAA family n=1 Tax=uncultured Sulfurovum sp. TaxID=269237 RepID=A0A6S6T547_9BACT|nr:MAG: ATPase, AAA family [uncultured Sulfurovum sp.]
MLYFSLNILQEETISLFGNNNNNNNEFDTELLDENLIAEDVQDKITYWILKIIIEMGGHKRFIDADNDFEHEDMASFLGLEKYVAFDYNDFKRTEPLLLLKKRLKALRKKEPFSSSDLLGQNIEKLSELILLTPYEKQVLEFVILLKEYDMLDNALSLLGGELNSSRAKRILNVLLEIPIEPINDMFSAHSTFNRSELLTLHSEENYSLGSKLRLINYEFADNMLNLDEDITEMIKDSVRLSDKGTLSISDYSYIKSDLEILMPFLNKALDEKIRGVNILLYGLPGTGKTELSKTIADVLGTKLYEISYANSDGDPIEGESRLRLYKTAQALFFNNRTLLMYDEAEDVFESYEGGFFIMPKQQSDKAWINKVLETNNVPTIWITNNISSIDNAIIRRFDMSIELPIPSKTQRKEIIKKHSNNILDEKSIEVLSEHEHIAPALISSAVKVSEHLPEAQQSKSFMQLINNTLKAQGYEEVNKNKSADLPNNYSLEFVNTNSNLDDLVEGIKAHENARVCLYGSSGTGKSAFAKHLAKMLDKPFVIKSGSSLMSKWIGETEKNIASAFREAMEEEAVLIFDEVDGFLAERGQAKVNWEVTQVNEMLVQMEKFDGIVIATTNLIEHLDQASLRRFDLKLEFKSLLPEQLEKIFISYTKELNIEAPTTHELHEIRSMKKLTPGDFATISRQSKFKKVASATEFIKRLKEEQKLKKEKNGNAMGFIN